MAYENLSRFISELEDDDDLVRVAVEVELNLEIAEITNRVCKQPGGGPAIVFENVSGSPIPVVTNLLGSQRRICKVLGVNAFDEVVARLAGLIQPDLPESWLESLKLVPQMAQLTKLPPKTVKSGLCQQVVSMGRDVDLGELPIPRCWPQESFPSITAGQVYTIDPQTGVRNVGLYPLEVRDHNSLAVHWNAHHDGWHHYQRFREAGQQMPIAIALGGDPIYTYMAAAPLPPNTDECLFGGFLRSDNIELVRCRSIEMDVPADAEIIIEGMIEATLPPEAGGILARMTGFYDEPEAAPVINVTAVTRRSNPLFPAMVVGSPPMEDYWLGKANERLFLPFIKLWIPELVDIHLPRAGVFQNLVFASIRKHYPQQARKVMNALWSLDRMMAAKMIVVVDADVDVHDEERVWFTAGANVHPGRDVIFCEGPTHMTDHAAPVRGMGHKMGLDATRKFPDEGHTRQWPDELHTSDEVLRRVTARWSEYGFSG